MFGRRRNNRTEPAQPPHGSVQSGVHVQAAVVANPDYANIKRQRAIFLQTGKQLQGQSGTVVGYDRGDPENSFRTVLQSASLPSIAMAAIGRPADAIRMAPTPEVTDLVMSNPDLDGYQALLWNRIAR